MALLLPHARLRDLPLEVTRPDADSPPHPQRPPRVPRATELLLPAQVSLKPLQLPLRPIAGGPLGRLSRLCPEGSVPVLDPVLLAIALDLPQPTAPTPSASSGRSASSPAPW